MFQNSVPCTTSERKAKANRLVHEGKVTRQDVPGRFWITSQSGVGGYAVDVRRRACDCADFRTHHEDCKHILAAEVYERLAAERAAEQAARTAFRLRVNARIEANKAAF